MELKTREAESPREEFLRGRKKRARSTSRWLKVLRTCAFVAAAVSVGISIVWAVTAVGRAPELSVHRVMVDGNVQLSDGEILEFLGLSRGANILSLDLEDVRTKLLRSAWIREVEVDRVLPATLILRISERAPVAVAVLDELYLLAEDGTILDQLSPRYETSDLVLARGLRDDDALVDDRLELAGAVAAVLASDSRVAPLISEVDVSGGPQSVALHLRTHPVKLLVSRDGMLDRIREIAPALSGLHEHYAPLEHVDLRFEGRIYLRPSDVTAPERGDVNASLTLASGGAPF